MGGLAWCIQNCAVILDVDLLYKVEDDHYCKGRECVFIMMMVTVVTKTQDISRQVSLKLI